MIAKLRNFREGSFEALARDLVHRTCAVKCQVLTPGGEESKHWLATLPGPGLGSGTPGRWGHVASDKHQDRTHACIEM